MRKFLLLAVLVPLVLAAGWYYYHERTLPAYWPLYREYRTEMAKVNDRFVRLLTGYLESYDNLTDEAASKMLGEYLSIDRARNSVKTKYVPLFGKVIPAKQVVRFFQIDNKLDAPSWRSSSRWR